MTALLPHLMSGAVAAAAAWLTAVFGFTEHARAGREDGQVCGAPVHLGNARIMLKGTGTANPAQLGSGTPALTGFVEAGPAPHEPARAPEQ